MKSVLEREKSRTESFLHPNKNTIHRSSLIVLSMQDTDVYISFLNHFLIKRNYKSIALKVTAIDSNGLYLDSITNEVKDAKVYIFNLTQMFSNINPFNYLVEFFSEKNLFVPFPAVMVNHVGKDFCNIVHAYNRVLNDIFEDDSINKTEVLESSIDVLVNDKFDTFFTFSTGLSNIKDSLFINYINEKEKISKEIKISSPRLSHTNFNLSKIFPKKLEGGVLKIKQPTQPLFYGRMLTGIIDKKTKAFSANHSYYDSSEIEEYFSNTESLRTYPYFENLLNKITMYPIMSPSELDIRVKIYSQNETFLSKSYKLVSPSTAPISININDIVVSKKIKEVSAFTIIAKSSDNRIPTRVNHQIIYGKESNDNLKGSINTSLTNKSVFVKKNKKSFVWGQLINHTDYESCIGFCFQTSDGKPENVYIDFYNSRGLFHSTKNTLDPKKSLIINSAEILKCSNKFEFIWFVAKSERHDLSAHSVHFNKISGNASAEHSFH